jgi:hypothetical protein
MCSRCLWQLQYESYQYAKGDTVLIPANGLLYFSGKAHFRNLHFIVGLERLYVLCKRKLKLKKNGKR